MLLHSRKIFFLPSTEPPSWPGVLIYQEDTALLPCCSEWVELWTWLPWCTLNSVSWQQHCSNQCLKQGVFYVYSSKWIFRDIVFSSNSRTNSMKMKRDRASNLWEQGGERREGKRACSPVGNWRKSIGRVSAGFSLLYIRNGQQSIDWKCCKSSQILDSVYVCGVCVVGYYIILLEK